MPDTQDKPGKGIAAGDAQPKRKRKKTPKNTEAVRTERGTFKKGHSGNPAGGKKQIFHTQSPWKQAIMRAYRDRTDKSGDDELQKSADALIDLANKGSVKAFALIGERLDGPTTREAPPPQQNTLQLVMNSIRVLNLTPDQRDAFLRQIEQQPAPNPGDGSGEPSGSQGSRQGD